MFNPTKFVSLTGAAAVFGAAIIPASSAFAADGCGSDATLVADGICEVTFTETPDSAWTPPVGITKLQALLVGAGGAVGQTGEYGGGGGEVVLVNLAISGAVDVTIGVGGLTAGPVDPTITEIQQGTLSEDATPGDNSGTDGDKGGDSGSGYVGYTYGSGAGAAGDAGDDYAGAGVVVSDIASGFALFATDDRCFGAGGIDAASYDGGSGNIHAQLFVDGCSGENGGFWTIPDTATYDTGAWWVYSGNGSEIDFQSTLANTGNGGSFHSGYVNVAEDGSDGFVAIRYEAQLAETGFDATGSIVAGTALVAGGAVLATRRRRASR